MFDLPQTMNYISFGRNKITNALALFSFIHFLNLKVIKISKQEHYKPGTYVAQQTPKSNPTPHRNSEKTQARDRFKKKYRDSQENGLKFVKPKKGLDFCGDLQSSIMDSNGLSKFSSLFPLPRKVAKLYASDIKLGYNVPPLIFFNNQVLEYLDLSNNEINCLGGPVSGLPSLRYLDLSKNYCFQLNPIFFSSMTNLTTLLLSNNILGRPLAEDLEGATFANLTHLKILDLSQNILEDLPAPIFANNANLKILNLSSNELSVFHASLSDNRNLQILDLSANRLTGFSRSFLEDILAIKAKTPSFRMRLQGNEFGCDCNNLFFLNFLLEHPELVEGVETFECRWANGSSLSFSHLARVLPQLGTQCVSEPFFLGVFITFLLVAGSLYVCALYHFKRWQWKYLYYVGRSRLHIGSEYLTYRPVADVFVTYDQENLRLRTMMRQVVRPRLQQLDISTVFGEVDFEPGFQATNIAGAVTGTGKTLLFLSPDIFEDYYRQFEFNLAVMHELRLRKQILVPVLLLSEEASFSIRARSEGPGRTPFKVRRGESQEKKRRSDVAAKLLSPRERPVSDFFLFREMTRNYPPEIQTFLKGQIHRCIVYRGDTDCFWQHLKTVILENQKD